MKLFLSVLITCLLGAPAMAYEELQINDLYFSNSDNDERYLIPNYNSGLPLLSFDGVSLIDARGSFYTFEEVMSTFSPYLESQFDTVIIANTAADGSSGDIVPYQHLRVLNKKNKNQPLFNRNNNGVITGIRTNNVQTLAGLPALVPVSSGKSAPGKIRTFSGIFPIQMDKTRNGANSTSHSAAMSFSIYVKTYYSNRWSGVAIHGTPQANRHLLGVRRDSGGCLRTFPEYAQIINNHVLSAEMYSTAIPKFSTSQNLPNANVQSGGLGTMEGSKALIIMFNGYSNQQSDI